MIAKWNYHTRSPSKSFNPRDFEKLNKMSIKEGVVTAQEVSKFRRSNDARKHYGLRESRESSISPGPYGCKNRV